MLQVSFTLVFTGSRIMKGSSWAGWLEPKTFEPAEKISINQFIFFFDKNINLRTVPTFVTAHTFCASRDTRVSYGWFLLIQQFFCAVENYTEKAELSKCSWYPKRKLGVTMHFSEIIKLQFWKNCHTLLYILALFRNIIA